MQVGWFGPLLAPACQTKLVGNESSVGVNYSSPFQPWKRSPIFFSLSQTTYPGLHFTSLNVHYPHLHLIFFSSVIARYLLLRAWPTIFYSDFPFHVNAFSSP